MFTEDNMEDNYFNDVAERAAFERVSSRSRTGGGGEEEGSTFRFDPVKYFKDSVAAISNEIHNDFPSLLKSADIDIILSKIDTTRKAGFKNPSCYILGYIVTKKKKIDIDSGTLEEVFTKVVPTLKDKSIKKEDIIRYGTLWIIALY